MLTEQHLVQQVIVLGLGDHLKQPCLSLFLSRWFYSAIIDFQLNLFQTFATENDALVPFVVSELHTVKHH